MMAGVPAEKAHVDAEANPSALTISEQGEVS
jgi:hypothetical protein